MALRYPVAGAPNRRRGERSIKRSSRTRARHGGKIRRLPGDQIIDAAALDRSLRRLRYETSGDELSSALQRVIAATRDLFSASGAGVMMVDDGAMLGAVAATDDAGFLLESLQERYGRGPCVDALTFDRAIWTADVQSDERWPMLASELAPVGVRAVLGLPIHADRVSVGSLNVYRDKPSEWSPEEVAALEAYATVIEGVLRSALQARESGQLADQLQHALDHRVAIERAVGVIMGREGIDAVAAFNKLRESARSSERKVADVAAELLARIPGNLP
jgi:GAF domain-containing protein